MFNSVRMASQASLRYVDIGINLTDPIYTGVYHGKKQHESDLVQVIERAVDMGCDKMLITASDLRETRNAIKLAKDHPNVLFATAGVHPCSATKFDKHPQGPVDYLKKIEELAKKGKEDKTVLAFGEIGLDYDRLHFAPKETQLKYFEQQLEAAVRLQLPLFLHMRAASDDFIRLISAKLPQLPRGGVVHSFTGTQEELDQLLKLGLDIGINGCSLKTQENLDVAKTVPLERLHLETDGPWCEIRPSHASSAYLKDMPTVEGKGSAIKAVKKEKFEKGYMVKSRTEPCTIERVAWVVAKIKGVTVEEVCEHARRNSVRMFGLGED
jgi:TatD DNase family protein